MTEGSLREGYGLRSWGGKTHAVDPASAVPGSPFGVALCGQSVSVGYRPWVPAARGGATCRRCLSRA